MGIEKLNELKQEMAAIKNRMFTEGRAAFNSACADVFAAHPKLQQFSWMQYTPYFNDGDPCVFSVNEEFSMSYDGRDYEYIYAWGNGEWGGLKDAPDDCKAAAGMVHGIISFLSANDEVALQAFGDHCKVFVNKDGVSVESYEHD